MMYIFWLSAILLLSLTSTDAQLGCGLNYYNYNRYPCAGGMSYSPFSYGNSYGSYSPYNSIYNSMYSGYGRQMNPYMYNGLSPLGGYNSGYNSGLGFQGLGYGMSPFSGISPYSGIYGGGIGTLDSLAGGNLYGAPGYSGSIFNTPFTGPLKKHAAQRSTKTIPKTTKDDQVKTQIVSLDQLINEMDKMSK
ncbi:hypothetical protein M3Y97_00168400 [Aphelenchoides bicaudatus]|nr:hypothetical protein M3Y97_00168400 [Aphelenchoides bicaudatus]